MQAGAVIRVGRGGSRPIVPNRSESSRENWAAFVERNVMRRGKEAELATELSGQSNLIVVNRA